jgi:hypothetical protein
MTMNTWQLREVIADTDNHKDLIGVRDSLREAPPLCQSGYPGLRPA